MPSLRNGAKVIFDHIWCHSDLTFYSLTSEFNEFISVPNCI